MDNEKLSIGKEVFTMKKAIAKTAALVMAAMMTVPTAAAVCAPMTVFAADTSAEEKAEKSKKEADMKAALTVAKKRVKVPEELTDFSYSTDNSYSTTVYQFQWRTPLNSEEYKRMNVSVIGDYVTAYDYNASKSSYRSNFSLAKMSEKELLEKAKGYAKQFNPDIYESMVFEIKSLNLSIGTADVYFTRYENGVEVPSNYGKMSLDKNNGTLYDFSMNWWNGGTFSDPKTALSEKDVQEAYKSLCKLTPYYRIVWEYDRETKKNVPSVRIIYEPSMNEEIDAYTGKPSTIWEDMSKAEGRRFYGYYHIDKNDEGVTGDDEALAEAGADSDEGEVEFTPAELEKIEQDNNLPKKAELFERFKKDPYVALNDNYKLDSYSIYSSKDDDGKENFYMNLSYVFDKTKKADNYYQGIRVQINATTGELLELNKWGLVSSDGLPKLDVKKANTAANGAAKTYSKDIFSQYKASPENTEPVKSWQSKIKNQTITEYETDRSFNFYRYVNGIQVYGDNIRVDVDALGTVTYYKAYHTYGVDFPKADILTTDQAFEKLYKQRKFDYYYDGWIDKQGEIHTYLLYKMKDFYLNAKTGEICTWNGDKPYSYTDPRSIKYTDIKGIPQEEAILTLQRYGIIITEDSKFDPNAIITEYEFNNLLCNTFLNYTPSYYEPSDNLTPEEKARYEADKKDKAETTREEAAVYFTDMYYSDGAAELKGIFKTPFTDVKSDNENIGYIAIAYAEGFIPLTASKKFNGGHKITRAEAAQMAYDYLKLISNRSL